jgi:hemolysin III
MLAAVRATQPNYTVGEELCNVITHGVPCAFALFKLLTFKSRTDEVLDDPKSIPPIGKRILLLSFVFLFLNSTLYHAMINPTLKTLWRFFDHFSVIIAMVGAIAPIIFHGYSRAVATGIIAMLFAIISGFVYFGFFFWETFEAWEVRLYFSFATVCGALTVRGFRKLDRQCTQFFLVGMVAYAAGVPLFIRDDLRYTHTAFHVAIAVGSFWHWRAIGG